MIRAFLFLVAGFSFAFGGQPIEYRLSMNDPVSHYFEVSIRCTDWNADSIVFAMPAWSPGRYVIYDFARHVKDVRAVCGSEELVLRKCDKQTWSAATKGKHDIILSYKVFANTLSGTHSQLNAEHANINGASVFLYVDGRKNIPVHLHVNPVKDWKVFSGAVDRTGQTEFDFPNYDVFIDTPMEISAAPVYRFSAEEKEFRVLIHNDGDTTNTGKFLAELQRTVTAHLRMMPPIDFRHYTFLFHFGDRAIAGDGMEHLNSTQVITVPDLATSRGYGVALSIASHEFFHAWNVKRLRPRELGPWDYSKENYTTSLWIAEGLTNYYGDLTLYRAQIYDERTFLYQLEKAIGIYRRSFGRFERSAEELSWDTWFWRKTYGDENDLENVYYSYYTSGELLGYLLDIEIRSRTGGTKGLEDVLKLMYEKFYRTAPAETYYLQGRGYTGKDFREAVNNVSGSDFAEFFIRYVSGKNEFDLAGTLAKVGLQMESVPEGVPYSGLQQVGKDNKILAIDPASPAEQAGLQKYDLVVSIAGDSVEEGNFRKALVMKTAGDTIPVTVLRRKQRIEAAIVLANNAVERFHVIRDPNPGSIREKLLNAWLEGK